MLPEENKNVVCCECDHEHTWIERIKDTTDIFTCYRCPECLSEAYNIMPAEQIIKKP